jgi:hypothetical protein
MPHRGGPLWMQVEHEEHRGRLRQLEGQLVPDADPHVATVVPESLPVNCGSPVHGLW